MAAETTQPTPTRVYLVRTRHQERRFRAGLCFGLAAVKVALTPSQLAFVQADPELVCEAMPMPELTLEAVPEVVPGVAPEVLPEVAPEAAATEAHKADKAKARK